MRSTAELRLTKHHGAGNDFLVLLDGDDIRPLSPAAVRVLCDRRRGIGADGLLRARPGGTGADLTMDLTNADGSAAEMSGNGIRCLAQAAVDAGWVTPPTFSVATAGGVRTVTFLPGEEPGWARASVDMGAVTVGPPQEDIDGRTARTADVGNPHLVLVGPGVAGLAGVEIDTRGPQLQAAYPEGINVEWIELAHDADGDFLELRVWERGAGETLACGTGVTAAGLIYAALNDATSPVRLLARGGDWLEVGFQRAGTGFEEVTLKGPADFVFEGSIEIP